MEFLGNRTVAIDITKTINFAVQHISEQRIYLSPENRVINSNFYFLSISIFIRFIIALYSTMKKLIFQPFPNREP